MALPIRFPTLARTSDARIVRMLLWLVALAYFASPQRIGSDSANYLLLASSLANRLSACVTPEAEGSGALVVEGEPPENFVQTPTGCVTAYHPHGTAFLVAPLVRVGELLGNDARRKPGNLPREGFVQHVLASLMTAGAIAALYAACRAWISREHALALAVLFAFGTSFYSTASRVLWTVTGELFLCCVGLVVAMRMERGTSVGKAALLGSVAAWLPFTRPTGLLAAVALFAIALVNDRRAWRVAVPVAGAWTLAFAAYSRAVFGEALPPYYGLDRLIAETFWEALLGNVLSPSRGIFVYSPFLLAAPLVFLPVWFRRLSTERRRICGIALAVIVTHWAIVSTFSHWFGGHGIGPRLMAETLPWFAVLVAGLCSAAMESETVVSPPSGLLRFARAFTGASISTLALLAVAFHTYASVSPAPWEWNRSPVTIDRSPERIFDWKHAQPWAGLFR